MYQHVLHRDATPDDLVAWSNEFESGLSFAEFVAIISGSDEASSAAESELDRAIATVGNMFCYALGRSPPCTDIAVWTEQLRHGRSLASFLDEILDSPEARRRREALDVQPDHEAIAFVYRHTVGREPSEPDLETWVSHMHNGMPFQRFLLDMLASDEARQHASRGAEPPDVEAIRFVYRHALGRLPSPSDIQQWSDHLRRDVSFQKFVLEMMSSEEAKASRTTSRQIGDTSK